MGVSMLSAMTIANNPVEAISSGPDSNGKWQGIVAHGKDHGHHPYMPILSTIFMYDSSEAAVAAMNEQIVLIRDHVLNMNPLSQ